MWEEAKLILRIQTFEGFKFTMVYLYLWEVPPVWFLIYAERAACLPLSEADRDSTFHYTHVNDWPRVLSTFSPDYCWKHLTTQAFCPTILPHWFSVVCVQPPLFRYVLFLLLGIKDKNQPMFWQYFTGKNFPMPRSGLLNVRIRMPFYNKFFMKAYNFY